jgi:HK97 family phage major capsid protein
MPDLSDQLDKFLHAGRQSYLSRQQVTGMRDQARDLERRAASADAAEDRVAALTVFEPPIYGPGSTHSWYADVVRDKFGGTGDGGQEKARDRLHRHALWQHREDERRLAMHAADAERQAERALSQSLEERLLLQRYQAAGGQLFEKKHHVRDLERRAMTRTDGQGGYLTVPGWLLERFIHAPRAGAPFAALWQRLPLPRSVSSVNLPRFVTGIGTGVQTADIAQTATRDPTDSFLNCQVRTLAATQNVAMQWIDQTPLPPDETIGADLAEDFQMQLDAQLLMGNDGALGQLPGVIAGGTFSASSMIWLSSTTNNTGMSWANGQGATFGNAGSLQQATAQLKRKIGYYRDLPATHFVVPESVWDIICGSGVDGQNRPLVPPGVHVPGAVPMLHDLPIVFDENIVQTFGGTTPPYLGSNSAGRVAPVDGTGTWVPILCGRWEDCIYWQSEPRIELLDEVASGSLQVQFRAYCYVAAAPARVVWGGTSQTFSQANQAGGVNANAPVSYGAVTNFFSNSILQPASAGYSP